MKTGDALWQAKQKCSDIIIVKPNYDRYLRFSKMANEIYSEYTNQIQCFGIDLSWLDVTNSTQLFGDGKTIADKIRERIKFELGITVSVGVSFNKIFSKLASDMEKPDRSFCCTIANWLRKAKISKSFYASVFSFT